MDKNKGASGEKNRNQRYTGGAGTKRRGISALVMSSEGGLFSFS